MRISRALAGRASPASTASLNSLHGLALEEVEAAGIVDTDGDGSRMQSTSVRRREPAPILAVVLSVTCTTD